MNKLLLLVMLMVMIKRGDAWFSPCPSCHVFGGDMAGCNLTESTTLPDCLPDDLVALFLRAYRPAALPSGFFANHIRIESLALQNFPSLTLDPLLFLHLPGLVKLDFEDAHMTHIHERQLLPLPKLEILYLNNTSLQNLPRRLLHLLSKLRYFQATNNDITSLPQDLLFYNPLLREVNLGRNRLFSLPAGLFRHNLRLQKVQLNNNRLQDLPPGLFRHNLQLQEVELQKNRLHFLRQGLFLTNAGMLKLGANPWHCTCRLSTNFKDIQQRSNLTGPAPKCQKPRKLKGIPLLELGDRLNCSQAN